MDVLLAERTNDKENQETSTVINKSLNAGIGILASVIPVSLVTD
jgi:hypothetical protein